MNTLHEDEDINSWMLLGYSEQEATELNNVAHNWINTWGKPIDSNVLFDYFKSFTNHKTVDDAIEFLNLMNKMESDAKIV